MSRFNFFWEFKALLFLLNDDISKGHMQLHMFWDFEIDIKWMNEKFQVQRSRLYKLGLHLKDLARQFLKISLSHIFRKLNERENILSKDSLSSLQSQLIEVEFRGEGALRSPPWHAPCLFLIGLWVFCFCYVKVGNV